MSKPSALRGLNNFTTDTDSDLTHHCDNHKFKVNVKEKSFNNHSLYDSEYVGTRLEPIPDPYIPFI